MKAEHAKSAEDIPRDKLDRYFEINREIRDALNEFDTTVEGRILLDRRIERLSEDEQALEVNAKEIAALQGRRERGSKVRSARRDALKRVEAEIVEGQRKALHLVDESKQRIQAIADSYRATNDDKTSREFVSGKAKYMQEQLIERRQLLADNRAEMERYTRNIAEEIRESEDCAANERYYSLCRVSAKHAAVLKQECEAIGFTLVKIDPRGEYR